MANLLLLLFMYAPSAPYRVLLPSMTVASAGSSCTSVVVGGGGVVVSPAVALVVGGSPSVGAGIILSGDILSDAV
jgi:hypothetical protein